MPHGQLKHLLLTAEAAQTKEMRATPAIDCMIGYQLPPDRKVEELLRLVLRETHGTPIFNRLEGHSRLQLLGLTHDTINNDLALVAKEVETGVRCQFCGEHILSESDGCRFCGTERNGTFSLETADKPVIDEPFLRAMVIHIAASERLDPCDVPFLKETIAKYAISDSEIAVEEGRLSSSFAPSYLQELPLTTWENQLITAGHTHDRTQYSAVRSLIELAKCCRLNDCRQEAQLLMKFAASRISLPETDEFLRDFMLVDYRTEHMQLHPIKLPPGDTDRSSRTEGGAGQ